MSVAINGKTTGGCTGKGFLPGKSGNPSGRSNGRDWLGFEIRRYLNARHPADSSKTRLQVLIERLEIEDPQTLRAFGFKKS
jgi:hypothetical protein